MTEPGHSLVLRSADREAHFTLGLRDPIADPQGWDSAVVDAEVEAHGFVGSVQNVYIQRFALDQFTTALIALERERSGRVFLCNTGTEDVTNELYFWMESQTGGGVIARVRVFRLVYGLGKRVWEPADLSICFEVDGGDLPDFVQKWKRVFRGYLADS